MNKLHYKNPDDLRLDVDQLMDFGEGKESVSYPAKIQGEDLNRSKLLSKYAQVLCCSFEKVETIEQQTIKFPQAIPKRTHPKKEGDSPGRDSS
jgi:hypothetical protein